MFKKECGGCRYWGKLREGDTTKCCNYAWITGRCRIALPPRADGRCPGYEAGERARANPKRHDKDIHRRRRGGMPMRYNGEQMRALWERGFNDAEIGAEVGAPARTVCSWRQRNGLPANVPQGGQKKGETQCAKTKT